MIMKTDHVPGRLAGEIPDPGAWAIDADCEPNVTRARNKE